MQRGVVTIRGKDTRDWLHRLSTQDVKDARPGAGCLNVFTNDKGRIVDVVHHLTIADDEVVLLCASKNGEALASHLREYVFIEDVEVECQTQEFWLLHDDDVLKMPPWSYVDRPQGRVVRTFDYGKPSALCSFAASPLDEVARIAAGIPASPAEINDKVNPLELALHDALSWTKGCYIGQEVIARIDNYGKQTRHLVRLVGEGLLNGDVVQDGKVVGSISSATPGQALALVRTSRPLGPVVVGGTAATMVARAAAQKPHD